MITKENHSHLLHIALVMTMLFSFSAGFAAAAADTENADDVAEVSTDEEIAALSVAPREYPIYPSDRPVWVDAASEVKDGWAELHVQSVPSISPKKSLDSLVEQQQVTLNAYLDELFSTVGAGEQIDYSVEDVERKLVDQKRTYDGSLTTSHGEMHQHASVLVLDEKFHERVTAKWQDIQVLERLVGVGCLSLGAFVVLLGSTVFLKTISPREKAASQDANRLV